MTSRLFSFACAGFLLLALLLGGASRGEVIAPDIVGLLALPLLGWAIWRLRGPRPSGDSPSAEAMAFAILGGCFLVGLIQLVPLPPALWTALPGRAPYVADLAAAGLAPGWAPISLKPQATVSALLALIPAAAVFLSLRTLDQPGRRRLVLVIIGVAVVSAVIGGLQVIGGRDSPLRFYAVTNPEPAVGFFANRNHLAALFVCVVPFATLEVLEAAARRPAGKMRIVLMLALIGLAAAGVAMTQSRAGALLLGVALLGGVAMAWRSGLGKGRGRLILAGGAIVLALAALSAPIFFAGTFDRFEGGFTGDLRLQAAQVAAGAAWTYAPFGSGLGSFVPVYMLHETPASMQNTYVNHAHDDWLELLVEGGLLVVAVMLAFLIWFGRQTVRAWRRHQAGQGAGGGVGARAASLVIGLLLAHSLVDYPLRTAAMMCVFALACGLMLAPRGDPAPGAPPV
ncbi:MAG: O-antigen ligase family protein [Caulobacter sp.]|nr:O-antigen ligase family protein [Caulobacter sp.]